MHGTLASVSTLLSTVGLPCRPRWPGRAAADEACRAPLDAGEDGGFLAADKGAGALLDGDVEREQAAQDVMPRAAPRCRHCAMASSSRSMASGYSARQ